MERRKLVAETRKAEHEAAHLKRAERLKLLSTFLPAATVLVTVLAVGLGYWHQSREAERSRANRREDQFTAAVRDFGSSSETAQAAAIATLDPYWRDPAFRDRIQDLLIASVETVRSPSARVLIQRQFIEHADSGSLARLADQNRLLTDRLFEIDPNMARIAAVYPAPSTRTREDSLHANIQELLGWNIATMISTINRLRTVRGANLSRVTFTRYFARIAEDSQSVTLSRTDRARLAPGVTLESVDLSGAFLAQLWFDSVTFSGVSMDSANLAGARFSRSRLVDGSSLAGFVTWVRHFVYPKRGTLHREAASWDRSTLDVERFYPEVWGEAQLSDHVFFQEVDWRIRIGPPPHAAYLRPRIPSRGTGKIPGLTTD